MATGSRIDGDKGEREATSEDVARLAGVSRTQVSYVFGGTGTSHVSAEKRERILAAAAELGYRPHHSAQALRRGFSKEFSIFFPAPYTSRINEIIGTIHESGLAGDCVVTQYSWNAYRDPARKKEAFEAMLARRPMGIFCSLLDLDRGDLETARARGIERILVLDVEKSGDFPTFYLPVEAIGRLAGLHLLERGHRRIAVLRPADPVQRRPYKHRLRGLRKALGKEAEVQLSILDWPASSLRPDLASARAFVESFLALPGPRPSALYAYSDDYAMPLLRAFQDKGIRVPRDLAILGTDDMPHAELMSPALSTIRFDDKAMGERAVAMINGLILGEAVGDPFLAPPEPLLVAREST